MADRPHLVLGLDGGHTGCRAALVSDDGELIALASGGAVGPIETGPQRRQALASVRTTIARVLRTAGPRRTVRAACLGLTLGTTSPMAARYHRLFRALAPGCPVRLVHDAVTNLAGASGGRLAGCVVIAGGGSIAYARTARGREARAGGWGSAFGDEGSAYAVGRHAVTAVARAQDGRGPDTDLSGRVLAHFGVRDPMAIRRIGTTGHLGVAEFAALAPLVAASASGGDAVARSILRDAARELADMAVAVLRRLGGAGRTLPVYPTGGLFNDRETVWPTFVSALRRGAPRAVVCPPRFPPLVGAVLLALRDASRPASAAVLRRLDASVETWRTPR